MNYIYLCIEEYNNGFNINILNIISVLAVLMGVFVLITKNPIVSILFLICLFLCIACYLILIGLTYIGLSYLLVYVGAVSILFLFILMLIDIRVSELQSDTSNSLAIALILGTCFYYIVYTAMPIELFENNIFYNINNIDFNNLYLITSNHWDSLLIENSHITSIGNVMYTSHFILLIIVSMILLLSMIGSIIITLKY